MTSRSRGGVGGDRCRPDPAVDQGDLAGEVAWTELPEELRLALDPERAVDDDEELVADRRLP